MIKYKFVPNQKRILGIVNNDTSVSVIPILDKLLYSCSNYIIKDIFTSISELNRYMHDFEIDINAINIKEINITFYNLLFDDNFSFFYDNIIRTLKALILTPHFDITPFEDVQFFSRVLFDILPELKHPSDGIMLLASILDVSKQPRMNFLDTDIMNFLFDILSDADEFIKSAIFSFFASALIIFDDFLNHYIYDITPFFNSVLLEKADKPKIFYEYFEILLQRIPQEYVSQCLLVKMNFIPLLEKCYCSDKTDQIPILKIILRSLQIKNKKIRDQIDIKYFKYIFEKADKDEAEEEEEYNERELNDIITILFYKIASYIIKLAYEKSSFQIYIEELVDFAINSIEESEFKVKRESFSFLNKLINLSPSVLPKLLEMNYLLLLSQYLECTGNKIKSVIIKSFLYILHTLTPNDEEDVFMIMEQEEIARKINEIEIDNNAINHEIGETNISWMIDEFNVLYDELARKLQYYIPD